MNEGLKYPKWNISARPGWIFLKFETQAHLTNVSKEDVLQRNTTSIIKSEKSQQLLLVLPQCKNWWLSDQTKYYKPEFSETLDIDIENQDLAGQDQVLVLVSTEL
jgi:hypothetical protein